MPIKTILAAAVLALSPVAALAECGWGHKTQQAMSCAEGSVFDTETNTCVVIAS